MNIQFFGATGMVTGSCYLLTTSTNQQVLIDCGMFQGHDVENFNQEPLAFDATKLSAVLLTHAHLDHCGRLPFLIKNGYNGKIYMTAQTKSLVRIALVDAVKIATEHSHSNFPNRPQLYTEEDVEKTLQQVEIIKYSEQIMVGDVQITFRNAGHILGAASIEVSENGKIIVFSGDIGNPHQALLQQVEHISQADVVIMESTYGNRIHPQQDPSVTLQQEINIIEKSGGVLLIPAFALDRTQVLLHLINHLKKDGKIKNETPVFLDSPMAIHATKVYREAKEIWSDELKSHTDDPFGFPNLYVTQEAKESENILKVTGSKVIIAGNGMMTGGRIWHHLIQYLPLSSTRVFVVGYQGEGTLGKEILAGATQVHIFHETVTVHASITEEKGLSAHADENELLQWLQRIQGVQQVFITHGEQDAREVLKGKIQSIQIKHITLPEKNSLYQV